MFCGDSKKISRDFSFNQVNNFEKLYLKKKKRLINIAPEHFFDVTLADFEQIINNDFIQLEAKLLNDIIFPGSQINLE